MHHSRAEPQANFPRYAQGPCQRELSFIFLLSSPQVAGWASALTLLLVLSTVSTFGAVAMNESNLEVDPNLLAVGIMYVIQLTGGLFQWCVRQSAEVESQMVSAERIQAFVAAQRAAIARPRQRGPENSPSEGKAIMDALRFLSIPKSRKRQA